MRTPHPPGLSTRTYVVRPPGWSAGVSALGTIRAVDRVSAIAMAAARWPRRRFLLVNVASEVAVRALLEALAADGDGLLAEERASGGPRGDATP